MLVKEEDSLPLIFSKLSFCSAETQSAARLTSEYQAHYHSVDLPLMEKIASESSLPLDGVLERKKQSIEMLTDVSR